jgi:hypothetical protein
MTKAVKQLARCHSCSHFAINHDGGAGGKPGSGRCVAPPGDGICECPESVECSSDAAPQDASWYERAINAASRIDTTHTTPWKVALVYSMLAIAESLGSFSENQPAGVERSTIPAFR